MKNTLSQHLLQLADTFASHANVTHWRVSYRARGDGQFFKRLRDGKGCTVKTAEATFLWFSSNWPIDLEWPDEIPRPKVPNKEEVSDAKSA